MMRSKYVVKSVIVFVFLALTYTVEGQGQSAGKLNLTLRNVVHLAIHESSSVKYAQNRYENYFWRYKNFQAQFRPQLILTGDLPNYYEGTRPVTQNDGSVQFREVGYFENSAQIAINQSVPQLGMQIYAKSTLFRYEDLIHEYTNFKGDPFLVGITQPIFAYNWMKWSRKTEPLLYDEAKKHFVESIERISRNATSRFFRYLQVQTNYRLAENNLNNSKDNLRIAETKIKLGTLSENDYSRIRLSVLSAQKALSQANIDLRNADFELKKYIGIEQGSNIELIMPLDMFLFRVDSEKALMEALENRKESTQYERRLIEADRDLTRAKRNNGLAATLKGTYGTTNIADDIPGVYDNTVNQKSLRLSLAIPILDWGKSSSNVKLAESKRDLVVFDVERDRIDFERSVVVQVEQFNLLKSQLEIAEEADKVANNGYNIAIKKFQNGDISITELNISLSEREKAKRDYIKSLENYWTAYYRLRELTLYDFEKNQKIFYDNPLLRGLIKSSKET
ncbi:TolC family protein [Carboxylicivirga sp. N1Y90]|uniref:TolC family protein n=1 Tax=Carboxylicivirga fragile TaxID=3417571 RepID=UPI003D340145|nr:TolC family protein [Marinilabiliaceae bacterium N1Y90]